MTGVVWVVLLGSGLFAISWPYVDVYSVLRRADLPWQDLLRQAFTLEAEYRPFLLVSAKALYEVAGLRVWPYQVLVLAQFAAVLGLLVRLFRPLGTRRGVAAAIALTCVAGLHTSRILFAFVPVGAHSGSLVLLLAAIVLALEPGTRRFEWVFLPVTLVALLVLESSLLIVPVFLLLSWAGAPGLGRRGMAFMAAGVAAYAAVRLSFSGSSVPPAIYAESGLGFSQVTRQDLQIVFENAPWIFWVYNVIATLLTVTVSEPREGVFRLLASILRGSTPLWNWIHVGSSLLTTILVVVGLVARPVRDRDRLLVVVGVTLVLCGSALGFLYTRDRIALTAGIGYALLVYVAVASVLERPPGTAWVRALVLACVSVIGLAWCVRGVETYLQLRDTAWDYHVEWTVRYEDLRGDEPDTPLLLRLRAAALADVPSDPRYDPRWSYALFERRPSRVGDADVAADSAPTGPRLLSTPFNIRWTPGTDEVGRHAAEAELGLFEGQPDPADSRGRTWTYRLAAPTRDRIRAILGHPAVEDTASIDTRRFEIQR